MEVIEFKNKINNRELHNINSKEAYEAAQQWQKEANESNYLINWSWDCGFKLDYDGSVCQINSRFYPPHKSTVEYGKYHGDITVILNNKEKHRHTLEAKSLDELRFLAEKHVDMFVKKIESALEILF